MATILQKLGDVELKIKEKINSTKGKGGDPVPDLDRECPSRS
jgi:hypothetical protein